MEFKPFLARMIGLLLEVELSYFIRGQQ